jgi:Protein of unknown function (DUF3147)
MVVKFKLSELRRTKWYEVILRILFGGLATVATGIVAKVFGPTIGGLFLAFPAIFPATATLVEKHQKERKRRAGLDGLSRARKAVALEARGAAMGSVGLAAFAIVVWRCLPGRTEWMVLAIATLSWTGISVILWKIWRLRFTR